MSTIASTSLRNRNSLLRLSVIGGIITGLLHLLVQVGFVYGLILRVRLLIHCNMWPAVQWVLPLSQADSPLPCSG